MAIVTQPDKQGSDLSPISSPGERDSGRPANAMLVLEIARGIRIALPPGPRQISTYVFLEQEDWFEDEASFIPAWRNPADACSMSARASASTR
jgi:hypothetical protein